MESMAKWRKFFEGTEADICTVIEGAIMVAASDCPLQFKKRRDKIMEKLYTSTSHCEHQYKSSWREVADEEIKSTRNVAKAARAGTSTMQEMPETKMDANHCSKQKIAAENTRNGVLKMDAAENTRNGVLKMDAAKNPRNGVLKMDAENHSDRERQCTKYKAFRIGAGRLKIVRHQHTSYEENLHDKLDFNPSSLPSQHKLNSPDDKSVKGKIEASKKRLQEGYRRTEEAKKQRTVQVIELQDLPSFKSIRPIQTRA